jgi:hypothetical protein
MRPTFIASSLLALATLTAAGAASAQEPRCKHTAPRQLALELAGVKAVVFDIGPNELKLDATPGAPAGIAGKACASSADALAGLKLTQERNGDKLLVRAWRDGYFSGISFKENYAYQTLTATLPDSVPVQLKVGSGDASVSGAPVLSIDVGSGDVTAHRIRGLVAASVGSGDIALHDVGQLKVISIGSGSLGAHGVRGRVEVGSIGSGGFEVTGVDGDVQIGSIGSGDADVRDVKGGVAVDSIGSGDVDARGVGGGLAVRSVGSGSIDHNDVRGPIDTPKKK